jgi:Zn-dependent protease with chaperone function
LPAWRARINREVFVASSVQTGTSDVPAVTVERWPTEIPLLVLVVMASIGFWVALAISLIGIVYAALIALFLFIAHVSLIAYVRGNGVRLGPEQFPEIHARVEALAHSAGLQRVPEAYLLQHGGMLNAFATRLFRTRMLVLFSDLLEACGSNIGARDMVIGHELGHIRSGHLSFPWLVAPGMLFPFLGQAYSQAREFTCDRWGAALCGDRAAALTGLAILAAGGEHGPKVNLRSLAGQRRDLDTGFMTLGTWLSTHRRCASGWSRSSRRSERARGRSAGERCARSASLPRACSCPRVSAPPPSSRYGRA